MQVPASFATSCSGKRRTVTCQGPVLTPLVRCLLDRYDRCNSPEVFAIATANRNGPAIAHRAAASLLACLGVLLPHASFAADPQVAYQVSFTPAVTPGSDKLISINTVDADVRDVLTMLSQQSGLNIVVTSDVQARVTVGLNKVPFEEALQTIVRIARLKVEQSGSTYVVSGANSPGPSPSSGPAFTSSGNGAHTVSLNAKDADLRFLVDQLINQAGIDVMIMGDLQGKVTIRLSNKPFEEALTLVFAGTRYSYNKFHGIYIIGDPTVVGGAVSALTSTEMMRLKFREPKEVLALLPPNLPPTFLKIDEQSNAVLVTGTPDFRRQVRDFLDTIDVPGPQVMLETTVLELSKTASRQLGLSFGGALGNSTGLTIQPPGTGSIPFELSYSTTPITPDFNIKLDALIQDGEVKIKANPKVAAANGQEASIDVTQQLNVRVTTTAQLGPVSSIQSIEAGVKLKMGIFD